jgi:hypothetical protein
MKNSFLPLLILFLSPLFLCAAEDVDYSVCGESHRVIVLTDIEADPDDSQSLVRLLLYSNEIDIRGIVATTSTHMKTSIHPESIKKIVSAYAEVYPNLLNHDKNYPNPDELFDLVKVGLPVYGMAGVGAGHSSKGSEWIIQELKKDDERPLWISVWGGSNILAQALYDLKATCSDADLVVLLRKLRIYTISDQDDSGAWIRKEFPELFYIVSPGGYGAATWGGINQYVEGIDNSSVSNEWLAGNIQQGHGPLGAAYPDVAYGMEGDTPAWLSLIPNGLNSPDHPNWGGWGGRYEYYTPDLSNTDPTGFNGNVPIEQETHPIWTNAVDTYVPFARGDYGRSIKKGKQSFTGYTTTIWRWRDDIQNDFAARMDWTVKSYKNANHPPVPMVKGSDHITVKSGAYFSFDARASNDPDGDSVTFYWFEYPEAGTCKQTVEFAGAENLSNLGFRAPHVAEEATIHIILRVSDKGAPSLSRYKRLVVTVRP